MKKFVLAIFLFCSITSVSNAALVDVGNGTVYDDANSLYWYQDFNTTAG